MLFNMNDKVRVKLTERGRKIHRDQHAELERITRKTWPYYPPTEDRGGWSEWQLWSLMELFGPHIHMGCDIPFETDVEIPQQTGESVPRDGLTQ